MSRISREALVPTLVILALLTYLTSRITLFEAVEPDLRCGVTFFSDL